MTPLEGPNNLNMIFFFNADISRYTPSINFTQLIANLTSVRVGHEKVPDPSLTVNDVIV